jgi:hypothetical protein
LSFHINLLAKGENLLSDFFVCRKQNESGLCFNAGKVAMMSARYASVPVVPQRGERVWKWRIVGLGVAENLE